MGTVSIYPTFDGLPQVNTISAGAVGSGRLVDLPIPSAGRSNIVFVVNVKDYFRWNPTDTTTADGKTIVALLANGVAAGRYERMGIAAPEWMQQATWFIDEANSSGTASDENDAASASTPLLTDAERVRRMGPGALWSLSAYHLRYLSDATNVLIAGQMGLATANVFLHGSATDGQGKATLATLAVDAVTVVNRATNTALLITSNGIASSWTASGLVNARLRFTSGSNIGGMCWAMFDAGSKQARMSECQVKNTFSTPYTFTNTTFSPASSDAFVVESLSAISRLTIRLTSPNSFNTNTVTLESLKVSNLLDDGLIALNFLGCDYAGTQRPGLSKLIQMGGVRIEAGAFVNCFGFLSANCYTDDSSAGVVTIQAVGTGGSLTRFITHQRNGTRFTGAFNPFSNSVSLTVNQLGVFGNSAAAGFQMGQGVHLASGAEIWGVCGAGGTPLELTMGSRVSYAAAVPGAASYYYVDVAAAPSAAWIQYRRAAAQQVTAPAFDDTTSIFTSYRTLTPANLQAVIGSGGLNGQFFDPISGCGMMAQ